jgi:hypothetical protein
MGQWVLHMESLVKEYVFGTLRQARLYSEDRRKLALVAFGVNDTSVICFHEGQLTAWRIADNSVIFERFWFCDGGSIVFSPSSLMIYCLQRTFLNGRSTNIVVQCGALDGEEIAVSGKYSCRSMEDILLCDPPVSNILL